MGGRLRFERAAVEGSAGALAALSPSIGAMGLAAAEVDELGHGGLAGASGAFRSESDRVGEGVGRVVIRARAGAEQALAGFEGTDASLAGSAPVSASASSGVRRGVMAW